MLAALVTLAFAGSSLFASGCSDPEGIAAASDDRLTPDTTYTADLDGDGASEQILIDGTLASLTITDGDVVYHSRDKWQVVDAWLGDTDHDGLLEVVTLLDDDDGRHIGLFANWGGEYRERLVTSELTPRPLSLEVCNSQKMGDAGPLDAPDGDLLLVTVEPAPGQSETRTILYRWNGFGFTAIGP